MNFNIGYLVFLYQVYFEIMLATTTGTTGVQNELTRVWLGKQRPKSDEGFALQRLLIGCEIGHAQCRKQP